MMGELLVFLGVLFVAVSMAFRRYPRGSLRIGPFSGTGMIGFLIMLLGVVTYLIEEGLFHP